MPVICISETDVYFDNDKVYGVVSFNKAGEIISNKVTYTKTSNGFGLHEFKCCCHPSLYIPCEYIVAFVQRLASGS